MPTRIRVEGPFSHHVSEGQISFLSELLGAAGISVGLKLSTFKLDLYGEAETRGVQILGVDEGLIVTLQKSSGSVRIHARLRGDAAQLIPYGELKKLLSARLLKQQEEATSPLPVVTAGSPQWSVEDFIASQRQSLIEAMERRKDGFGLTKAAFVEALRELGVPEEFFGQVRSALEKKHRIIRAHHISAYYLKLSTPK